MCTVKMPGEGRGSSIGKELTDADAAGAGSVSARGQVCWFPSGVVFSRVFWWVLREVC